MARFMRGQGRAKYFGKPQFVSQQLDIIGAGNIASLESVGAPIIAEAGGVWPIFYVEAAFANVALDLDANVTWTDLTSYVRAVRVSRGRSREQARFDAGTISVDLDNRDMRFSPENSGSPYFPYVKPNKRVRVRVGHGPLLQTLGNAYANSWSEQFIKPKDAVCTLDATDAFKLFARYEIPDSWALAASALAPYSWYRLDERTGTQAFDSVAARSAALYAGTYQGSTYTLATDSIVPGANTAISKAVTFNGATAEMLVASAQSPLPVTTTSSSIVFKAASKAYNLSDPVSLSVTKPSGVVANDTLVAFVDVKGQRTLSTPSGWTAVRAAEASGSANSDAKLYSFWKTAGSSEPASYTFTQDNGGDIAAVIFAFTGCDTVAPVDVSGGANALTGSTITAPSVTTTGANRMLVCGFAFNPGQTNTTTYSISPPAGMTEPTNGDTASKGNGSQVNNATVEGAYVAVAGAGATGAKVASLDTGNGQHAGVAVALKPTTAGAGAVPTPFTIACWIKQTANQGNDDPYIQQGTQNGANSVDLFQAILSNGGDLKLVFRLGTNVLKSTQVIPANTSCLVIARYDGALSMKLDVAGGASFTSATSSTIGAAIGLAAASFEVGKADTLIMDEVTTWQRALTDAEITAMTAIALGTAASETVIAAALNLQGWPSDLRAISAGTGGVTVSNVTTGATAGTKLLDFMQSVTDTERGALYMTGDGKVGYETIQFLQNDSSRSTIVATFGQGIGEIGYSDLAPDYSDQIIVNDVQITNTFNTGATNAQETYQQQDADSMSEFSRYTLTLSTNYDGAIATRQLNAAARMAFELARYKQPQRRIQSITIEGTGTAADWDTLITLTMLQRVRVNHVGPDGTTTISKDYTIRGFDWEYTASPKSVKLTLGLDEGAIASAV